MSIGYLIFTRAHAHHHWRRNKLSVQDWIWYIGLPTGAYLLLLAGGAGILLNAAGVGVALTLLLVIGIRNAWDLVLWMACEQHKASDTAQDAK